MTIMMSTVFLSSILTALITSTELTVKLYNNSQHLPPVAFFLFLGADTEDINIDEPWVFASSLISLVLYALALLVYKIIKIR